MRLALAIACLPACSFAPVAAQSDAPAGDRQDGPHARVDAAIDAHRDGPRDALTYHVLESLVVSCDGATVTSTTVLSTTGTYRLEASGECTTNTSNGSHGDAEYFGYNVMLFGDAQSGVDVGISINNATPGVTKVPNWGSYTDTHIYDVAWVGVGATIAANFWDPNYTNNDGSLMLAIEELE